MCLPSFYELGGACESIDNCPFNTYRDNDTLSCKPCSEACINCHGPTNFECSNCNYLKGYAEAGFGECQAIACAEGEYARVDERLEKAYCAPCNETCASCDREHYCIDCKDGFLSNSTEAGTLCDNCAPGFFLTQGRCQGTPPRINYRDLRRRAEFRNKGVRRWEPKRRRRLLLRMQDRARIQMHFTQGFA